MMLFCKPSLTSAKPAHAMVKALERRSLRRRRASSLSSTTGAACDSTTGAECFSDSYDDDERRASVMAGGRRVEEENNKRRRPQGFVRSSVDQVEVLRSQDPCAVARVRS